MTDRYNDFGQPIGEPLPDWEPRPLPSGAPMVGRYCRLERINADLHAVALYAAHGQAGDWRDWTYLPYGPFHAQEQFVAWAKEAELPKDPMHFTVIVDGRPLGTLAQMRIDPANGAIEIGHIRFSPALQRTRAATEAVHLVMCRAFDELGYRRHEWKCDALNLASRRAAERFGFTFEGIFRQAAVYKGRSRDTAWYSIIDKDWQKVRTAFESWLSPANFDDKGRQHRALETFRRL